jgi:hypothetical protein
MTEPKQPPAPITCGDLRVECMKCGGNGFIAYPVGDKTINVLCSLCFGRAVLFPKILPPTSERQNP